jgi:hypothetical protein
MRNEVLPSLLLFPRPAEKSAYFGIMDDGFELPVHYKNKELFFPGKLESFGWTHRIVVDVYGTTVSYERDEEGQWRALVSTGNREVNKDTNVALLKTIADAIKEVLK